MLRRNFAALVMGALAFASIDAQHAKTDQAGDPLPPGASARMGTLRWRHGGIVSYVGYTPDGKAVLSVASDNTIRLWDRETGKEIRRFEPKGQNVGGRQIGWANFAGGTSRVAMSPDGKLLAVVLPTNAIQLWNVETGKELREFKATQGFVNSIRFAPDSKSMAARASDRNTYLVDIEGNAIRTLKTPQPNVAGGVRVIVGGLNGADGFAFSHDGKAIAAGEMEFNQNMQKSFLKITNTTTGEEIRRLEVAAGISSVAYSADGKFLAYASGNIVHLCQADGAKEIRQIDTKTSISGLAFSPDSKTIAAKGRDQVVRVYESDNGNKISELGEPDAFIAANAAFVAIGFGETRDFAYSHDGKVIAMGGTQALRFFTVATGKEQAAAGGHRTSVTAAVVTPDGKTMFSRGADKVIRRWDAATGKELGKFAEPIDSAAAIFSPDGKTVAVAVVPSGIIHLINTADGKKLHELKGHNGIAALVFSPDSKTLASRGVSDNTIKLFDVANGGELKQITISPDQPKADPAGGLIIIRTPYGATSGQSLVFSPDGQTIAAYVSGGNIRVANPGGGVAMQAVNGVIHQWDVLTAKEIRKISMPAQRTVVSLAYSPNGRLLAAENADQTVSILEIASGKERALLGTPSAGGQLANTTFVAIGGVARTNLSNIVAPTLAFTPDGGMLAVRGPNNSVRVWDVAHTKELVTFKGHDGAINAIAMAGDGKRVASASTDTTLLVWDLTRVKREPTANVKLELKEVESLWADLFGDDAEKASRGILKLSGSEQTTPFLRGKLKPATAPDAKQIDQWIHDLDSVNFPKRTKASIELEKLGELAIPALRKILDIKPSPETRRRVEPILEKLTTGTLSAEQIRFVRAVETLERIGNSEARQLLQTLADGAPGALATRHAQAALHRMGK